MRIADTTRPVSRSDQAEGRFVSINAVARFTSMASMMGTEFGNLSEPTVGSVLSGASQN